MVFHSTSAHQIHAHCSATLALVYAQSCQSHQTVRLDSDNSVASEWILLWAYQDSLFWACTEYWWLMESHRSLECRCRTDPHFFDLVHVEWCESVDFFLALTSHSIHQSQLICTHFYPRTLCRWLSQMMECVWCSLCWILAVQHCVKRVGWCLSFEWLKIHWLHDAYKSADTELVSDRYQ